MGTDLQYIMKTSSRSYMRNAALISSITSSSWSNGSLNSCLQRLVLLSCCFFVLICSWELPSCRVEALNSSCRIMVPSPTLTKFVDQLPIPKQIAVNTTEISIAAWKIKQKLHRDLPPTTLYAYGESQETAVYPGPTLEAKMDVTSRIHWDNHIPDEQHFLPVDRSIHWANPKRGGVPTVVHLHGAETESIHDGHPEAWWTPKGEHGPTYVTQHNSYPNTQRPAMLWYHDHVVGITRLNVVAGLSGLYFLRSPEDKLTKHFPYGEYEIPLVFKDWHFWPNGSINFPNVGDDATIHPSWCPGYAGDTILVNGKVWPYLDLQPRVYRFRLLNGANARFFNFTLSDPSLRFHKIGTDGGYLDTKPQILSSLLLAPAERLDILVDFSSLKPGDVVFLNNSAPVPFPDGLDALSPPQTRSVMKFQVTKKAVPAPNTTAAASTSSAESSIGDHLRHAQLLEQYVEEECNRYSSVNVFQQPENSKLMEMLQQQQGDTSNDSSAPVLRHRQIRLREFDDSHNNPTVLLLENRRWLGPVREFPVEGSVEVWEWINTTPEAHPIHMHLIQFQVLNQQPFNTTLYLDGRCNITVDFPKPSTCFTGPPIPPEIYQTGFKDTAAVSPSFVTRYRIHFQTSDGRDFPFDPTLGPGYIFHCHILDHEDNDMMRPFKVVHARKSGLREGHHTKTPYSKEEEGFDSLHMVGE
jgi:spore coat protein A